MGKHPAKASRTAAVPSGSQKGAQTPLFDEAALGALTQRIEGSLTQKLHTSSKDATQTTSNKSSKRAGKVDGRSGHGEKAGPVSRKKRDAQGNLKDSGKPAAKPRKAAMEAVANDDADREALMDEILALGGTEEDFDLIADAVSDEDDEAPDTRSEKLNQSLQKELANFVKGLGIDLQDSTEIQEDKDLNEADTAEDVDEIDDDQQEEFSDMSRTNLQRTATTSTAPEARKVDPKIKDPNRLVFEARPDWHAATLPELPVPVDGRNVNTDGIMAELKIYASSLLETDSNLYASKHLSSTSSHRFLSTIMSSGTLSDKVSALTLVVQESPVHTTKSFESLLALAKKRSRGQAVSALGALKDLLASGVVLPADRRLRQFSQQPGLLGTLQKEDTSSWRRGMSLPGAISEAHLISWAFEDWLKEAYFDMLKLLEGWCNDEIDFARQRAVTYVFELLREKPEQEANLLRLLVNKLGDPDKKIASRTSYLILQLQTTHPVMKTIIIRAIESEVLLRPNQSSHARYYAINTLNQTILSTREEDVAKKLLSIYFELFVNLLKKPEPLKAIPGPKMNKKGQVQGGGGEMGKKAKEKAEKEEVAKQANEETMEKMISAVLTGVNRAFPFAGDDHATLEKHMDMLFRITHASNFNTSVQALMLIQQLAISKHLAVERFYRTLYESILDPRLINSSKHALYLNLLYRALSADLNIKRVKAFAKRLLQVISLHQPAFACGILYLLRELETTFPALAALYKEPEANDEIEEEVFRDVPEDDATAQVGNTSTSINYVHPDRMVAQKPSATTYDGRKRDPEHSNADQSCLWEILPFLVHYHPSVALFATRLLEQEEMPPKPDLSSHTLIHFLDRFVYRNAKSSSTALRGNSIMQPLASSEGNKAVLISNKSSQSTGPLNSDGFWRKKIEDVAADEAFFHEYFSKVGKTKSSKKKKQASKATDEDGGMEDGEDEDEIWQALVESRPEVEGGDDDESDFDMHELEDSDAEISSEDGGITIGDQDEGDGLDDMDSDAGDVMMFDGDDDDEVDDIDASTMLSDEEVSAKQAPEPDQTVTKKETSRSRKKKMKSLPTFASADDYAAMLDQDADEDTGM